LQELAKNPFVSEFHISWEEIRDMAKAVAQKIVELEDRLPEVKNLVDQATIAKYFANLGHKKV